MANRRITELPSVQGNELAEQDLLTLVRVFEVDPTLKNKKITLSEFSNYLNTKYLTFSGGTMTGPLVINSSLTVASGTHLNTVTVTGDGNFNSVFVESGLTVTGTFSGTTITGTTVNATNATFQSLNTSGHNVQGDLIVSGSLFALGNSFFSSGVTITGTLTGTTITGTSANFSSGVFTERISGASITGNAANFTTVTGATGVFTSVLSGLSVTGAFANFSNITGIVGVFTSQISGDTITGTVINTTSGNINSLNVGASGLVSTGTISALNGVVATNSGVFVSAWNLQALNDLQVLGLSTVNTITGNSALFTVVTGITTTGTTANFSSGVFTTQISGATITGDTGQFGTLTGNTGQFSELSGISGVFTTQISGATITGDLVQGTSGVFTNLLASNLSFTSATISGDLFVQGSGYFSSGINVTGVVSGQTITGASGLFTSLSGDTAGFTSVTGQTVTGGIANFVSGVFTTQVSGTTFTGNTAQFTVVTGQTAGFGTITGGTITGDTGLFTNITGNTLHVTAPSGGVPAIICSGVVSGDASGFIIQGPLIILP